MFGKMDMVGGYIIENLLPIWGKGHLILIGMLGSMVSEQDNLSKKYDEKHKETKTIWNIFAYYFTIYLFTTNNWIVCGNHFRVRR